MVYIDRSINSEPSDQTDLKGQRRCNLGGGGEPTFKREADRWGKSSSSDPTRCSPANSTLSRRPLAAPLPPPVHAQRPSPAAPAARCSELAPAVPPHGSALAPAPAKLGAALSCCAVRLCPDLQCKILYFGDGRGRDVIGSTAAPALPPQLKQTASIPSKNHRN
jgi:hypothetical protein